MRKEKNSNKMKRAVWLLLLSLLLLLPVGVHAQACYTAADSVTVVKLLKEAVGQGKKTGLPLFFARKLLGRPYVAYTLEVNDEERLVVNTRQLDYTTLVETVTALSLCAKQGKTGFADYLHQLTMLRYREGRLNRYPSRLHYFSDWIDDNAKMGWVEEVQSPNPPFSQVQKLKTDYMSQHPTSYKALRSHPEFIPEIRKQEKSLTGRTYRFIPKSEVKNTKIMRAAVKDGDIIAITCSKPGLDIAHLGFAVWKKDGLHLLNASMIHKKVVDEPMTLYQYLQKHPSHTGIRIVRMK